jgi:hypothetical protein
MPDKHPNTKRWGGPGASHEDRTKPMPQSNHESADGSTNPPVSQVSGGGGERDRRHSHMDEVRSSKRDDTHNDVKPNRPRPHGQ